MALKGDLAQYLSGMPVMVAGCNIAISQPTLKDIVAYGETNFLLGVEIFVKIEKMMAPIKQGNPRLARYDDFQVLLAVIKEDKDTRNVIENLFGLILEDYEYEFSNGSINFFAKGQEDKRIIGQLNPMNFEKFQVTLKELFLPSMSQDQEEEYNPANDRAAEIAAKLKKGREKVAQMKSKESGVQSVIATYTSTLSVGLNMDINILYTYTLFQLFDTFKRYLVKDAYDFYRRVSTMPMMDTSKLEEPDNWMGEIYK